MKKAIFFSLLGLLFFAFAAYVYNPPGDIVKKANVEYVTSFDAAMPVLFAQDVILTNDYCLVPGGARSGVVNSLTGLYAETLNTYTTLRLVKNLNLYLQVYSTLLTNRYSQNIIHSPAFCLRC